MKVDIEHVKNIILNDFDHMVDVCEPADIGILTRFVRGYNFAGEVTSEFVEAFGRYVDILVEVSSENIIDETDVFYCEELKEDIVSLTCLKVQMFRLLRMSNK